MAGTNIVQKLLVAMFLGFLELFSRECMMNYVNIFHVYEIFVLLLMYKTT